MVVGLSVGGTIAVIIIILLVGYACKKENEAARLQSEVDKQRSIVSRMSEDIIKLEEKVETNANYQVNKVLVERIVDLCNISEDDAWDIFTDEKEFLPKALYPTSNDKDIKTAVERYFSHLNSLNSDDDEQ